MYELRRSPAWPSVLIVWPFIGGTYYVAGVTFGHLIWVIEKRASSGVQASSAEQYGQYENFMMLGKDALWAMLVSTLVANDLFLIGQKMCRKGMASNPLGKYE